MSPNLESVVLFRPKFRIVARERSTLVVPQGWPEQACIAHANPYHASAPGYVAQLVELANDGEIYRRALVRLARAVNVLQEAQERQGKTLPAPVIEARDVACRALGGDAP